MSDVAAPRPDAETGPARARPLPRFAPVTGRAAPRRALSFITVDFSGELQHNLLRSPSVHDPRNELIVVDNRANLSFDTLSAAWLSGLARARHDLVALVHEDVLLLPPWQAALERALEALELADPDWGVAGVAGWRADGVMAGHWSDPGGYFERMGSALFREVVRIDEHLVLLRRSRGVPLDAALPSIHLVGDDLPRAARARGLGTYVLDAPTVHKFADAQGRPIRGVADSPKIQARDSLTYLADRSCSDDYFARKWGVADGGAPATPVDPRDAAPVILLARGGGGSRLIAYAAEDCGVHLGNETNVSGDALELVQPIYRLVLDRFRYRDAQLDAPHFAALLDAVRALRERAGRPPLWGFKLPEALLLPDLLLRAFPQARFVHFLRDPLDTCLRRTHMTARFDNQIGQAALLAAYRDAGLGPAEVLADSPAMRMARTTRHQIDGVRRLLRGLPASRWIEVQFEALLLAPHVEAGRLHDWLHAGADARDAAWEPTRLLRELDPARAASPQVSFAEAEREAVAAELHSLRLELGYLSE